MRVSVRLYSTLTKYLKTLHPGTSVDLQLPDGATVDDLIAALGIGEAVAFITVNRHLESKEVALHEGDEVSLFGPVGGG